MTIENLEWYIAIAAITASVIAHIISYKTDNNFKIIFGKRSVSITKVIDIVGLFLVLLALSASGFFAKLDDDPYIWIVFILGTIIVFYLGIYAYMQNNPNRARAREDVVIISTNSTTEEAKRDVLGIIVCASLGTEFILILFLLSGTGLIEGILIPKGATQNSDMLILFNGIMSDGMIQLTIVLGIVGLLASYSSNKTVEFLSDALINWLPALLFAFVLFGLSGSSDWLLDNLQMDPLLARFLYLLIYGAIAIANTAILNTFKDMRS